MILNNWVAENQIRSILNGNTRTEFREKYGAVKWARNWWYPVENLPENTVVRDADLRSDEYSLDTDEWLEMAAVLPVWPYSRQRFFQVVENGEIERIEISLGTSPFWVYNKSAIKDYILRYAITGRLKKAVEDLDEYLETVEAW